MRTLSILAAFIIIVCGGFASAEPIDPDPDGMSIYFDTEGTIYCLELDDWEPAAGAGPEITAYLMVTRPDPPYPASYVQAWEAHMEIDTNSFLPPLVYLTPGMSDYNGDPNDYQVSGWGTPITGDVAVIASIRITWQGLEGHAQATYSLWRVDESLAFPDGPGYVAWAGFPTPCQPLFGEWGEVAWINGGCLTIADESLTWGEVKSLY
jgi:hypothetical protein